MSTVAHDRPAEGPRNDDSREDNAKRRQILDGARRAFLANGFDAASMNEIARAAGVSKGTLYVYFKSKEELFEAIVEFQKRERRYGTVPSRGPALTGVGARHNGR